ncbi:MAG: DUF2339 domain-containing protein [Caulobacteraceae bacterium]
MELWVLAFLPLGVWVWLQQQRIDALARRIAELELELFNAREAKTQRPAAEAPAEKAEELEPLLLTEVVPDDVLVLDTPLPEASNDMNGEAPTVPAPAEKPRMHSPLLLDEPAEAPPTPTAEPPHAEPERAPPPSQPKKPARRLDQWLAESGLAWVAGVAIALGAIYLVSLVAQSSWFTAPLRLASAIALGAAVLAASEWTRRSGRMHPPGHPLVSALLAGAGVVVFYATIWAAHGIYGFVDWPVAAALLTLCALALIALSLLHGEALGVLAIGLALLAPAFAHAPLWPSWVLTVYLSLVGGGGFVLAAVRRWVWVAVAAIAGFYFWFFASIAADDVRRALALLSFASLGGVGMAFRQPIADEARARLTWSQVNKLGPSLAVGISSALLIWAWLAIALSPSGAVMGPALISAFHVALAAYAVRERRATPVALAITIGALVLGFMAYLRARFPAPLDWTYYPALLSSAFLVIVMALAAHPHRMGRVLVAASGSIGAALLTVLAASSRPDWHSPAAWAPLFAGAALLLAAAWRREGDASDRRKDSALDFWGGGAAALMLLGVESALPEAWRTVGHASVALSFSVALAWRGWRVMGWAALTAGALSVAHSLSPALISAVLGGHLPLWVGLLIIAIAAAFLFAASTLIRRKTEDIGAAEALSAAAVIVALVGLFVLLRWIAAGGAGVTISGFTETSLRGLALMGAGLTLLPRIHENPGPIGAWRGHVLLGLGLLYALLVPGLGINPWWGAPGRAVVSGMPLLNVLALSFAAPAALAFVAANRLYTRQLLFARIYAVAGAVLALIWAAMELRYAFHNAAMAAPAIGLFESACYGLAVLAFALAVVIVARMRAARNPHRPFTQDLVRATRGVTWTSISFSVLILMLAQHPIWGLQDSTTSNAFSTLLAVIAQFGAAALALMLARALSISKDVDRTRFAAASAAVVFLWSAGHCAIRWMHHRGYMDDGAPLLGIEGLLHAVWPLALVTVAAHVTRLAPGRHTVRTYLYDLQAIWSAAIWPALMFAGLGLWLMFNPWWGAWPALMTTMTAASAGLGLLALAAALSNLAPDVPHAQGMRWLVPTASIACAGHLFVLVTLIVRWLYHGSDMSRATAGELELWVYSAVWALFAAAALTLGTVRNDAVLRWIGLAVFAATIVKVVFIDTSRLSGVVRAASVLGLGVVAAVTTWLARRNRPPPNPGDLVTVRPSARRERRRVRRRTSP